MDILVLGMMIIKSIVFDREPTWAYRLIVTDIKDGMILGDMLDEHSDDEHTVTKSVTELATQSGIKESEIVVGMGFHYEITDLGNGIVRSRFIPIRHGVLRPWEAKAHQRWLREMFEEQGS